MTNSDAGMKPEKIHFLCHHRNTAGDGSRTQELLGKYTEIGYKSGMENTDQGDEKGRETS